MDPVKVAFECSEPRQHITATGKCARCAAAGNLTSTRSVVSPSFTGFDKWSGPVGGLCPACVWLYRTTLLRTVPHLVTQVPSFAAITAAEVYAVLATGPLRPTVALCVPLRPGRKHLFADLTWGTIRTDHANLTWTSTDAGRLEILKQLRRMGFSPSQLASPAPPFTSLRRHPSEIWANIQHLWASLNPWRSTAHWLNLALKIT